MKDEKLAEVGVAWPAWLPKPTYVERRVHAAITIRDGDQMSYDDEALLLTVTRKDGAVETFPFTIEE